MIELKVLAVEKEGRATEYRLSPSPVMLGGKDSYGVETLHLTVPPAWAGLVIRATFTPELCEGITRLVDGNGELAVDAAITAEPIGKLTLEATGEGCRYYTHSVPYVIYDHEAVGEDIPAPDSDLWQQFVDQTLDNYNQAAAAAAAAKTADAKAMQYEADARQDMTEAEQSAVNAAIYASNADGARNDAVVAMGSAWQAAGNAEGYAESAQGYASEAGTAKTAAETAQSAAETEKAKAETAATDANTAADRAEDAADRAEGAANRAEDAAEDNAPPIIKVVNGGTAVLPYSSARRMAGLQLADGAKNLYIRGKNLLNGNLRAAKMAIDKFSIQYIADEDTYLLNGVVPASGKLYPIPLNATDSGAETRIASGVGTPITISTKKVSGTFTAGSTTPVFYIGQYANRDNGWLSCRLSGESQTGIMTEEAIDRTWFWAEAGTSFNNFKVQIQIEVGEAATAYEPYDRNSSIIAVETMTDRLPPTLYPYTTVFSDAGEVMLGYVVDTRKYVDAIPNGGLLIYPVAKTNEMTSPVGVDGEGRLFAAQPSLATAGGDAGLVKLSALNYGLEIVVSNGCLRLQQPNDYLLNNVIERTNAKYTAVTLGWLDKALKASITTNTETLTDEEKAAALAWLGAVGATDYASTTEAGVIKVGNGLRKQSDNALVINPATDEQIEAQAATQFAITPALLSKAVKVGLTDNKEDLTDEEKAAVLAWLGAIGATDYPDGADKAGAVKVNPGAYGVGVYPTTGYLYIASANNGEIDAKTSARRPIVPANLDYAIKVGLTTNTETLTAEQKAAALAWLGVDDLVGDIETALDSIIAIQTELIGGEAE